MKIMKIRTDFVTSVFFGLMLVVLSTLLLAPTIMPAFGYNSTQVNDTFTANVTVGNLGPTVISVLFNDNDTSTANMTLAAGSDANIMQCNATISDLNGWQDIWIVNATFYLNGSGSGSSLAAADDKNNHYTNTTCSTNGSGTNLTAVCTASFEHEALNGTWNCTISVKDNASAVNTSSTTTGLEQLVALTVGETGIHFGSLNNQQNSTVANTTNITNQGNAKMDLQVQGTDMSCTAVGQIGVGNISFNVTSGSYDTMVANKLSTTLQSLTLSAFNLVPQGVAPFADTVSATNLTYWTIYIPAGVRGECNNTITVVATLSAD
jgi:hypothetical protein